MSMSSKIRGNERLTDNAKLFFLLVNYSRKYLVVKASRWGLLLKVFRRTLIPTCIVKWTALKNEMN